MYAFAVILTYPILLYGAIQMLWPLLRKRLNDSKTPDSTIAKADYLFRAFLVMITCMITKVLTQFKLK